MTAWCLMSIVHTEQTYDYSEVTTAQMLKKSYLKLKLRILL